VGVLWTFEESSEQEIIKSILNTNEDESVKADDEVEEIVLVLFI